MRISSSYVWLACLGAAATLLPAASQSVLFNFRQPPRGASPFAGLTRDSAGNLYGVTAGGGQFGWGTLFKIDPSGHATVLHAFNGSSDGGTPYGTPAFDNAGNIYGTTTVGGASGFGDAGNGTIYKLTAGGQFTVLYSLGVNFDDGLSPYGGVTLDGAGNIYGTASGGGPYRGGTLFRIDTSGNFSVLHAFGGTRHGDGAAPQDSLLLDSSGNLYGTTYDGGAQNAGTVFEFSVSGQEIVLYSFAGGADGQNPYAATLTRDSTGNLYGTTFYGGAANQGVVYRVDPTNHETVLYSFTGQADGGQPYGGVVLDSAANLYGTTSAGGILTGACSLAQGCGVVFKLSPTGRETVLHAFSGTADGSTPTSGLWLDPAGELFGTTFYGGTANLGAVYAIGAAGSLRTVFNFPGPSSGFLALAGLFRDSAGDLYGTTRDGGSLNQGVVFKLDGAGRQTPLYTFTGGADGGNPESSVIRDSFGNLYGTTYYGGESGNGVVYRIAPSGQETVLHGFAGGADGAHPTSGLTYGPDGRLYGNTYSGGTSNQGVLFRLNAAGDETILHTFTGGNDGGVPDAPVSFDATGNLYGTTSQGGPFGAGVVYKLDSQGVFSTLYTFTGGNDGLGPVGAIPDASGNLYGVTTAGGAFDRGVVFKLTPDGAETVLYAFTGGADGSVPRAAVILDSEGNIYGTTYNGGGNSDSGVVYKVRPNGQETVLYSFTNHTDGGFPSSGVIRDPAGNLYGVTSTGGKWSEGVIYEIH